MRVLHVVPSLDPLAGGTVAAVDGLARAQAAAGLEVEVFATFSEPAAASVAPVLKAAGVKVTAVGPTAGALRRHPDMAALLRPLVKQADVVHLHGLWEEPQWLASTLARKTSTPVMLSPHGMLDAWPLRQKWLKKRLYRLWRLDPMLKRASAFHLTTDEEASSVARFGFDATRVVVPLGLDLSEFQPPPDAGRFRSRNPGLGDDPLVLFLSRLHHKKGVELLIPAFAELVSAGGRLQNTRHRLVVAGPPASPAYFASLAAQAEATGVADRIHFVGNQEGVERIEAMVDADVFVLPSHQENFGIVVVEAAAAGLPLVVSEHVNLASFVSRENLGAVVSLNVEVLAAALADVLLSPDRKAIGDRARACAAAEFDWAAIGPKWEGVYAAMLVEARR